MKRLPAGIQSETVHPAQIRLPQGIQLAENDYLQVVIWRKVNSGESPITCQRRGAILLAGGPSRRKFGAIDEFRLHAGRVSRLEAKVNIEHRLDLQFNLGQPQRRGDWT